MSGPARWRLWKRGQHTWLATAMPIKWIAAGTARHSVAQRTGDPVVAVLVAAGAVAGEVVALQVRQEGGVTVLSRGALSA